MYGLNLEKIASSVHGELVNAAGQEPSGVSIDTRSLKKGDLFFAIKGENADGHIYLEDARKKGACGAVAAYKPDNFDDNGFPLIIVEDTVKALQQLASAQRDIFTGPVVAVTGSTGKTSTKDMIISILSEKGPVLGTMGNHNNELGLPLTLLSINREHKAIVVEMGMRGLGEIDFLCRIAQPLYGVITNIGHTHQELLGSQEKIAQAKAELISHIPAKGGLVLNISDEKLLRPWLSNIRSAFYWAGVSDKADISAKDICSHEGRGNSFTITFEGREVIDIDLPVPGSHNIGNALAAAAVAKHAGLSWEEIRTGLAKMKLTKMRLEFIDVKDKDIQIINDAYNANPDSMASALEVLQAAAGARRTIAVLGDMYELGDYTDAGHLQVGRKAKEKGTAYLITVGKLGAIIAKGAWEAGMDQEKVKVCENNGEAVKAIQEIMENGDVILVKGSRGVKMEQIIAGLLS